MSWIELVGLALLVMIITSSAMVYGYWLAIKHVRHAREQQASLRAKRNTSDTPIYDEVFADYDVD